MRVKFYTTLQENGKSLSVVRENAQIVPLQPRGERPPFFMVDSFPYFIDVLKLTGADQPVFSLIGHDDTQSSDTYSLQHEAAVHVKTILAHQPRGPYMLGGCSASGIVAYEVAQQLRALNHEVGLLVLFETPNPYFMREYSDFRMSMASYRADLAKLRLSEIPGWVKEKLQGLKEGRPSWFPVKLKTRNRAPRVMDQFSPFSPRVTAARRYRPDPYPGRLLLVKRDRELVGRYRDPQFGWGGVAQGKIEICTVSSLDHLEIFKSELDRSVVAQSLRRNLDEVIGAASSPREARVPPAQSRQSKLG